MSCILAIAFVFLAQQPSEPPKAPTLVPDLTWRPKAGDTASVYSKGLASIPCATEYLYYPEFDKLLRAKDGAGFEEMLTKKQVLFVKNRTSVLVLEVHSNQFLADHDVIEVRFQDGSDKGKKGFIDRAWVHKMVEKGKAIPPKAAASKADPRHKAPGVPQDAPAEDPVRKAARKLDSLMRTAKALETSNPKAALESYHTVVKEFPDSAEAKTAAGRIKALTKP